MPPASTQVPLKSRWRTWWLSKENGLKRKLRKLRMENQTRKPFLFFLHSLSLCNKKNSSYLVAWVDPCTLPLNCSSFHLELNCRLVIRLMTFMNITMIIHDGTHLPLPNHAALLGTGDERIGAARNLCQRSICNLCQQIMLFEEFAQDLKINTRAGPSENLAR